MENELFTIPLPFFNLSHQSADLICLLLEGYCGTGEETELPLSVAA